MKPNFSRFLTFFSLGFHGLSVIGWLWLSQLPVNETIILLLLLFLCIWTPLAIVTLLWLLWANQEILKYPLAWGGFQVLFFIFLFGNQLSNPTLSSLSGIYFIVFLPILLVYDFIYACRHHLALQFLAFGSLVMIWSIVIGGRFQGDLLLIFLDSIGKMKNPLLWLNGVMASTTILMLAGFAAFFVDGLHLLLEELRSPLAR